MSELLQWQTAFKESVHFCISYQFTQTCLGLLPISTLLAEQAYWYLITVSDMHRDRYDVIVRAHPQSSQQQEEQRYQVTIIQLPDQARNGYSLRQHANHHHFVLRFCCILTLSSVYVHPLLLAVIMGRLVGFQTVRFGLGIGQLERNGKGESPSSPAWRPVRTQTPTSSAWLIWRLCLAMFLLLLSVPLQKLSANNQRQFRGDTGPTLQSRAG